jgi:hypothetical protein
VYPTVHLLPSLYLQFFLDPILPIKC